MKSSTESSQIGKKQMITALNQIIHQVFRKNSLEELTRDEAEDFVRNHPYSSTGRLILALKSEQADADDYALYFHNPTWYALLKMQLSSSRRETALPLEPAVSPAGGIILDENKEEANEAEAKAAEASEAEISSIDIENYVPNGAPDMDIPEETDPANAVVIPVQGEQNETPVEETPAEIKEEQEKIPSPEVPKVKKPAQDSMLFMPYHSVDFFASQGIQLSENELSKDKFGKQLKSFTEWLKSMKKLPSSEDYAELDKAAETKLNIIAEASLSEHLIVTETMAEVWEKQGKFDKAVEIYEKLSLQNPSKSHYFADKIQKIKNKG